MSLIDRLERRMWSLVAVFVSTLFAKHFGFQQAVIVEWTTLPGKKGPRETQPGCNLPAAPKQAASLRSGTNPASLAALGLRHLFLFVRDLHYATRWG